MRYVDVVLPLPLEGFFTYSLPDAMSRGVEMGVRVLVPLGRSKTYTALVAVALRTRVGNIDNLMWVGRFILMIYKRIERLQR